MRFGPTISRRCVLGGAISAVALGNPLRSKSAAVQPFPAGFVWGASTSSYQIEGAVDEDGRGKSIWDLFSHAVGRVKNGDTGDVACDHYHRWREDLEFISRCGFGAYRFSTSWPRILPTGSGTIERRGLDFYDRLVDGLIARGIAPWLCLYHWDLPQALQDQGGWLNRDIVQKFAEYARIVARRLGDRVKHWALLNEPNVHALFGHGIGSHAPGLTGLPNMLAAIHHQNLAQGVALQALRAERSALILGTVLSLQPVRPSSAVSDVDRIAYLRAHLAAAQDALTAGIKLRGYFVWSLLDNFEWQEGYSRRFGVIYVDFKTLKRTPKASYQWLAKYIKG
jgi:beta-glucosidase